MSISLTRHLLLVAFLVMSMPAQAVLKIDITEGFEGALPIAVVPFAWSGWGSAPEDVAGVVAFLASPAADYLTGQVIHVSGGFESDRGRFVMSISRRHVLRLLSLLSAGFIPAVRAGDNAGESGRHVLGCQLHDDVSVSLLRTYARIIEARGYRMDRQWITLFVLEQVALEPMNESWFAEGCSCRMVSQV